MKCKAVRSLLSEYISEELSTERKYTVEEHLKDCPECRSELAALERAVQDLQRPLTVLEAPDMLDAIKARAERPTKPAPRFAAAWGVACVGVVLVLLVCWMVVRPPTLVVNKNKSAVTADSHVKDQQKLPAPDQKVAQDSPVHTTTPNSPVVIVEHPKQVAQIHKQIRHRVKPPVKHSTVVAAVDRTPKMPSAGPKQMQVAGAHSDAPRSHEPVPGELRYQSINGQGYVYRELAPGPDWSPKVRVDVMVVPDASVPGYPYLNGSSTLDRLASAEYAVQTGEGAMLP